MNDESKTTTISVDVEVLKKLSAIANRAKLSKVEILTEWINAVYSIMTEGLEECNRINIASYPDLKSSSVRTMLGGFSFGTLNALQLPKPILNYLECEKKIEDIQLSGHQPTLEEMLKLGFKKEDVEKLLAEKVNKQ